MIALQPKRTLHALVFEGVEFFVPLFVASLGDVSQEMTRKFGFRCLPKVGGALTMLK